MVEIDDAGSGSLIGGTGIGIWKKETQEYLFDLIPLQYFQQPSFSEKKYQDYVINIVEKAFQQLQISKKETIYICRGYIFDNLKKWLSQKGYTWENTKIEDPLQNKVETSFNHHVIKLGLPENFIIHARYAFGFHRLFKWVMADFKNRAPLCKTGWKSWQKWSGITPKSYRSTANKNEYCLKCGKLIYKNHPIRIIEYQTNRLWKIPLHTKCSAS